MGNLAEVQPQVLVLKGRTLRAEGVLLHQHLAVGATVIRGYLHTDLLRALLPTLLHLVHKTGDWLGEIELKHDVLGGILPRARPTCGAPTEVPVDQVLERVIWVLG